ncbi:MAG: sigma-70 family RNA polymerase sigma factor [Christensenellales bacterium]
MCPTVAAETVREQRMRRWVQAYGDAILRTCYVYLSNRTDAEDAMQDTFLKAWQSMEQYERRNNASEKTWLMRIAINVCHDYYRSRWFRRVDMRQALSDLPERYLQVDEQDRTLILDVMRLPEKLKQVILLHYYHDMTLREIAQVLGLAPSSVHHRLNKATQQLRTAYTGGEENGQ